MENSLGPKEIKELSEAQSHFHKCPHCGKESLKEYEFCEYCGKRKFPTLEKIVRLAFELGQSFERQEMFGENILEQMQFGKDEIDLHPTQYAKEYAWEWWELRKVLELMGKSKLLTEEELNKIMTAIEHK